ncbi:MAG: creatininase family protein, partial [Chloroflexota bacterium]|nr:creatininase family protein [Chloroflexota bacterium]
MGRRYEGEGGVVEPTRAGLTGEEDATVHGEEQPLLLANLTWEETRDRLPEIDLVLIPVGAHEQHGPGIAVSTDTVSAEALCHAAAARVGPRVAVAPA